MIEALESRIAPASLVLMDADGDKVTVKTTTGNLGGKISIFTIGGDPFSFFLLDLSDPSFDGTNLTVSVAKGKTGDGQIVVGSIKGGTNNFGTIKIAGDLLDIDAGSGSMLTPAIQSLAVNSYGRFGERYYNDVGYSQINGDVGTLAVKGDFIDTNFYVTGTLAAVSVGGSVIGGPVAGDGQIYATEDIGKVAIKKDLRGGSAASTGIIGAGRDLGTVAIGGSIYGGQGANSGHVLAAFAGDGEIGKVTVGGSVIGGAGQASGQIGNYYVGQPRHPLDIGTITIGKDLVGGSGLYSGFVTIEEAGTLKTVTIKGSIVGGPALYSGSVYAYDAIGTLTIGGSLYGGEGSESGGIVTDRIEKVSVGGSLYGGKGSYSGKIYANSEGIGLLKIRGDVRGGTGDNSGTVFTDGQLEKRMIGGLLIPGGGLNSGTVT